MIKLTLICGLCNHEFVFRHPGVNTIERLARITINCPECQTRIMLDAAKPLEIRVPMIDADRVGQGS